ncbi:hypothetical protein B9479_006478 [Cryptococcus floricola]|uniref:Uncharacterized protein n=1 Tax=Cryptococcus floricola TaxID=2591691 RepID=A0A5D3AS53_9TREE|nr:hypothetical protein B9479_006478 [Cryptococcus floricola]
MSSQNTNTHISQDASVYSSRPGIPRKNSNTSFSSQHSGHTRPSVAQRNSGTETFGNKISKESVEDLRSQAFELEHQLAREENTFKSLTKQSERHSLQRTIDELKARLALTERKVKLASSDWVPEEDEEDRVAW